MAALARPRSVAFGIWNPFGRGMGLKKPPPSARIINSPRTGEIQTRERLGGLLKFYYRKAE